MDAYLWYTNESLRHLIRAGSVDQARAQIAVTHGQEVPHVGIAAPRRQRRVHQQAFPAPRVRLVQLHAKDDLTREVREKLNRLLPEIRSRTGWIF